MLLEQGYQSFLSQVLWHHGCVSQHLLPPCWEPTELCLPYEFQQISERAFRDITDAVAIGLWRAQNHCVERRRASGRERGRERVEKKETGERNSKWGEWETEGSPRETNPAVTLFLRLSPGKWTFWYDMSAQCYAAGCVSDGRNVWHLPQTLRLQGLLTISL